VQLLAGRRSALIEMYEKLLNTSDVAGLVPKFRFPLSSTVGGG